MDFKTYRLINNFILLKNEGKDIKEIIEAFPSVNSNLINKWENELNNKIASTKISSSQINEDKPIAIDPIDNKLAGNNNYLESKITSIDKDGNYIYSTKANFSLSLIEGAKFRLWEMSTKKPPYPKDIEEQVVEKLIYDAKESLAIWNQISDIKFNIEEVETGGYKINSQYTIAGDSIDPAKADKAILFYFENFMLDDQIKNKRQLIKTTSSNNFNCGEAILPICLKRIEILNYSGIKKISIENLNIDNSWLFVVGENGYGKTSLLQAIAMGLHGKVHVKIGQTITMEKMSISVEYKDQNESKINGIWHNDNSLDSIFAYGPSRLTIQPDFSNEDQILNLSPINGLFTSQITLMNIENKLVKWQLSRNKRFETVKELFLKLIPSLKDLEVKDNDKIVYIEKDMSSEDGTYDEVDNLKLASGFRTIIAFVGDLILRFMDQNPENENPSDFEGIVIIDEFDLHWHPKMQILMPGLLSKAFPYVQFIVSTHSSIPLLGAPKNSTIIKVNRSIEEGITAEKLDIDISNLTPNLILTSPIFDMESISSVSKDNVHNIRTEDDYDKLIKSDENEKFLKEKASKGYRYPNELFKL